MHKGAHMEPKVRRRSSKLPKLRIYARIYTLFRNTNKAPSTWLRNSSPENVFAGISQQISSRVASSKCLCGSLPADVCSGRSSKCLRGPLAANVFASCLQHMSSPVAPANVFAGRLQQMCPRVAHSKCVLEIFPPPGLEPGSLG